MSKFEVKKDLGRTLRKIPAQLYEKSLELAKSHSESQLLEMRNGLEKSCEDFREKFDAIQKQKIDALDLDKPKPSNARHPFFNYHSWSIGILLLSLNIKYEYETYYLLYKQPQVLYKKFLALVKFDLILY